MAFVYAIIATIIVSLISLVGIFTIWIKSDKFEKFLIIIVGFAAGSLIGSAFLHLLPEAAEKSSSQSLFLYALIGFTVFFLMEKYFYWRHCHNGVCEAHAFTYLNLIGDGIHNFVDGMVIAASFVTDTRLGVITTLVVIFHEIPQEIGDFSILIYGGFSKKKALVCNFICGLTAVVGAILGYFLSEAISNFSVFLIAFTAGGFIYIASSDLIPEMHKHADTRGANISFAAFILGLAFMFITKAIH